MLALCHHELKAEASLSHCFLGITLPHTWDSQKGREVNTTQGRAPLLGRQTKDHECGSGRAACGLLSCHIFFTSQLHAIESLFNLRAVVLWELGHGAASFHGVRSPNTTSVFHSLDLLVFPRPVRVDCNLCPPCLLQYLATGILHAFQAGELSSL